MALLNYKFYIQIALVACFFVIPCLTMDDTEVTASALSHDFLTPVVSRLVADFLCTSIFFVVMWQFQSMGLDLTFFKKFFAPLVFGIVSAAIFNTVFVLEFWGLFAVAYLIEHQWNFISTKIGGWSDFTNGINCLLPFLVAFALQLFEVNDAIYTSIGYNETIIIDISSDDSSSQDDEDEENDETETETDTEDDETEADNEDEDTDNESADSEDDDTSKDQDDSDAKDGDDDEEDEDEDDKVTEEDDEDVSEDGDDDDETESSSSTTTEVIVSDGASGTEASVSITSDASALPYKNLASSPSAASTPTVGICSAVAAVVVSIVAFFF